MKSRVMARVAIVLLLSTPAARPAFARPQYAAREGKYCVACHIDPAGGGMRHGNGFKYALGRHAWDVEPKFEEWKVDPEITKGVRVGGDIRYTGMAYQPKDHSAPDTASAEPWTFSSFGMQGSIYLSFNPVEHLFLYYNHDLGATVQKQRDWWGMVRNLTPLNLYVKFGQIRPAYGIRLDDHTPFVRAILQGAPGQAGIMDIDPRFTYPGVEVGLVTGGMAAAGKPQFFAHAGYNDEGSVFAPQFTRIREKMIGGRAGIHAGNLIAGASFRANGRGDGDPETRDHRRGVFALFGRPQFALIGEADAGTRRLGLDTLGAPRELKVRGGYLTGEYYVNRGLTVRAGFNYMDVKNRAHNRDADLFSDVLRRYDAAVDLIPIPFLKLTAEARFVSHSSANPAFALDEKWGLGYAVFSF